VINTQAVQIETFTGQIESFTARIAELERRLDSDSTPSAKPPLLGPALPRTRTSLVAHRLGPHAR